MAIHKEPLSGGLVTSRDPSELAPGELTLCDNLIYQPSDDYLHTSPGVSTYSTAFASSVLGLVGATFDNAAAYLVAMSNGAYWISQVSASAFTTADTITNGTTLDSVPYNNKLYLLNGVNKNRVFLQNGAFRAHGMLPVTAAPGVATATGTWSQSATGYYEYWTTEVYVATASGGPESVELESTFVGDPATIFVASSATRVLVNRPIVRNDGTSGTNTANRWRVYRSPKKDVEGEDQFPSGFLVADLPIDTQVFNDGSATQSSYQFVTAATATGWTSPTNAGADDATRATATANSGNPATSIFALTTFSGVAEPVQGIEVEVEARFSSLIGGTMHIALSWDGGSTYTSAKSVVARTSDKITVLGGATDKWGRDWTAAEFASSSFRAKATMSHFGTGSSTAEVDYIKVRVNYDGTNADVAEEPFPAVVFEAGGVQIAEGANGPPPIADTGDIYEDSFVCNDVSNPRLVRYSLAGQVEAFPDKYTISIDTAEQDHVRNIKALPGGCGIGCDTSLWRVNYLPRATDSLFDRGRAIEIVDPVLGIVGPRAAARLRGPGGRMRLAAVANHMLYATDLFTTDPLSDELDWARDIDVTDISQAILLNDTERMQLLLIFPQASNRTSSTNLGYMYHFNYHPSHIKSNGRLKISGPTTVWLDVSGTKYGAVAGCAITHSDNSTLVFLSYPTGASRVARLTGHNTNLSDVRTRQLYLAGEGSEWATDEQYVHHEAASGETVTVSLYTANTGGAESTLSSQNISPTFAGYSRTKIEAAPEGARLGLSHTPASGPVAYDKLLIKGENFGREDSGKP